ncbi:YdcF family protein [Corynebacterium guangdongense]|uniref:Vancomycin permeability regulator SanA n=1 Tax=Corynebacterium guangdongense TaxID=1783348 RepID=A0ABU2A1G0_9CORY|nr:YdcF family protein [Corynebacterium guangdongense]MDR7329958.1 vancomycin permeability regulator SanA [Corynebacterium guangdongense]WJZ18516.1 hypothetical protein CGUA_09810 [Corynebacterium guangdongense]
MNCLARALFPLLVVAGSLPVLRVTGLACRRHAAGPQPGATAVAVLGTTQYDGRPSPVLQARIDHAADIARADPSLTVVTLGGNLPGDRFTEAGVAAEYLERAGVDKPRPVPVGNSTWESLEALPGQERWVIVTTALHAARTESIARQIGLDARVSGAPDERIRFPKRSWWVLLRHEVGGLLVADVSATLGRGPADRLEAFLRRVQLLFKPSDRSRLEQLENR